jgi:hypothetical protein
VSKKIDDGVELSSLEQKVLWFNVTQEQVDFVKANL